MMEVMKDEKEEESDERRKRERRGALTQVEGEGK